MELQTLANMSEMFRNNLRESLHEKNTFGRIRDPEDEEETSERYINE